jgi:hypothetical protein
MKKETSISISNSSDLTTTRQQWRCPMKTQILFLMALLCAVVAGVHSTQANTIRVTNTNDSGPGSLREALAVAKDGDTIDATRLVGRIVLTSGALQIRQNVSITGPGAGNLAVNGNFSFTVFENFASDVTISGFTITDCNGDGIINHQGGLTVSKSRVVFNAGGGISNNATLTITNCTVSGNDGVGISNRPPTTMAVRNATLTVSNCTISGNSGPNGGGIYNAAGCLNQFCLGDAGVTISNSTLSGNSATGYGGAIYNNGGRASVNVKNSTISGNSAPNGGGIYLESSFFATLELGSTILNAGNLGGNIVNNHGKVTSLGYNLASDNGGGS